MADLNLTEQRRSIRSPADELNGQIIAILEEDGRTPFSEIAMTLGVSEGTIRNRVSALREANMLRIVAIADPVAREYKTDAILGVKVAPGVAPADVAFRFQDDPRVVFALWVAGSFDLILEIVSDDADALQDFLEDEIHSAIDIAHVEVMMGMKNFKNQFLLKRDCKRENG
ncbi:MAG: Lrp/AsnC family transcriptional regulator [Boseongicola sp.]|nr:Lrp/AsnC family transcriptional regulator [Boseongicola sp.]